MNCISSVVFTQQYIVIFDLTWFSVVKPFLNTYLVQLVHAALTF